MAAKVVFLAAFLVLCGGGAMMFGMRFVLLILGAGVWVAMGASAGVAAAQGKLPAKVVPQLGYAVSVTSVAFSPDGQFAIVGGDYTPKLWELSSGRELRVFEGEQGLITSVAYSPDGRFVLSGSMDKKLKLWDVSSGAEVRVFAGHKDKVSAVAFSPDGRFALSGSWDNTLKLWDVSSGHEVRSFAGHKDGVSSVAYSPDGRFALSGSTDNTLKLWDVTSGLEVRTLTGHQGWVFSVAFSLDSRFALSGSDDGTVRLWEVSSGRELRSIPAHQARITTVAFSPDGRMALSGSEDKTLKLWEVSSGREMRSFVVESVTSVAFSPDGRLVLHGAGGKVRLWEVSTWRELRALTPPDSVKSVAYSPDGRFVLHGVGQRMKLWEVSSGRELRTFIGHTNIVTSVAFSPDGRFALSGSHDKMVKLWEVSSARELRTLTGHKYEVFSVAFSPDGRYALSGGLDKMLKLWDVSSGREVRTFKGHKDKVTSVAFSPDGRFALSGSWDKTLKLWAVVSGRVLHTFLGHKRGVNSVAFSPDGQFALSGSLDTTLKLWDMRSRSEVRTFTGHTDFVASVAFSPDGRFAISGSLGNTVRLWDVNSGSELGAFIAHQGSVKSVAFSPRGLFALSGSDDGTTRLWDLKKNQQIAQLMSRSDGEWLTITPAGFFTGSPKGTEMLNVVRGVDGYSVQQFYEHLNRPDLVEELLKGDPEGKHKSAAYELNLETILDSGPLPKLERLFNREKRNGSKVELAVRLIDKGGGIGEKVIWRVNGITQGAITAPGPNGPILPGRYAVMAQTLTLDPTQKAEIEVVAYNAKGLLATQPLRFTIDPLFGLTNQPPPKLFVLAVGVNDYLKPDWRLKYAVNDAKALGDALKAVGSSIFGDNIEVITVLDKDATEAGIAAAFDKLAPKVHPRDVFVLFLSGHGRSIAGTGWFFLPQDLNLGPQTVEKNGIGPDKLQKWLGQIPAKKSVIVLDACEAGASEAFKGGDRERETVLAQLEHATGRNTIAAAANGKAAYEGYRGHGVLTYAILEALNKQEGAVDETVDLLGVASHISRRVIDISKSEFGIVQTPKTDLKDNFPLGIRKTVLKPAAVACKLPDQQSGPSHIIIRAVDVREKPSDDGSVTLPLTRNALVTLKACAGTWGLIARGGKEIGYAPLSAMEPAN